MFFDRFVPGEVKQGLAKEFDYPYHISMQDWEYEVSKLADIEKYFIKYNSAEEDDVRFLLMEMIIETSNEEHYPDWLSAIWSRVQVLLRRNFLLHQYTVYYWCCFGDENIEDCFNITASMRTLWKEQSGKNSSRIAKMYQFFLSLLLGKRLFQ